MTTEGYRLLDSGEGKKLEAVGGYLLVRPAPQAAWRTKLPPERWREAHARYLRSSSGGGEWAFDRKLPEKWEIGYGGLRFLVKPTGFGHIGLFPEHAGSWRWMEERIESAGRPVQVLNLFAYTGGATLAAVRAGASVCHLDASKGAVDWARENAALSGVKDAPIRWIVDDVLKFLKKESRRDRRYDGILLDPPSFGRGSKGEVWKIEDDLPALLSLCREVLTKSPLFVHLSCHTPGFSPIALENLLADMMGSEKGNLGSGEMTVAEASGRLLPSGCFARWSAQT